MRAGQWDDKVMLPTQIEHAQIVQLQTPVETEPWCDRFADAYRAVFSGEPYFESFTKKEAEEAFRTMTSTPDNITLLAVEEDCIVGFGISVPLMSRPDVARELTGLIPIKHTHYLAELGVIPSHRGRGLGSLLIKERIARVDPQRYSHVVLRVATDKNTSYDMYCDLGFVDMGVYMDVPGRRIDGSIKTDRRLFLHRVLSQVRFD